MQRLTENTIEDIVNRSVNHKNMSNSNDLNINNKYKVLFVCLGSKCYIKRGDFILSNYTGSKDVLRIPKNRAKDASVISKYRALTGDQTTVFKIYSEKKINRKINRLKNRYIK